MSTSRESGERNCRSARTDVYESGGEGEGEGGGRKIIAGRPPAVRGSRAGVKALRPSGGRCVLFGDPRSLLAVGDHGLTEAEAEITELRGLFRGELRVAFREVLERVIHPLALLFLGGLEHAAAVDVAEELVASAIEKRRSRCVTTQQNPPWNQLGGQFERGRP